MSNEPAAVDRSLDVRRNPAARCLLTTGEPHRQRRYWEHMPEAGLDLEKLAVVRGCPFQGRTP